MTGGLKGIVPAEKWSMRFAKKTRALGPALPSHQKGTALTGAHGAQLQGRNTGTAHRS